jgi:hypothetical protein
LHFAGLLISLVTALERPFEDKPSRACETGERSFLAGGRLDPESVDFYF